MFNVYCNGAIGGKTQPAAQAAPSDQLAAAQQEVMRMRSALYQASAFLKTGGSSAVERAQAAIRKGLGQ